MLWKNAALLEILTFMLKSKQKRSDGSKFGPAPMRLAGSLTNIKKEGGLIYNYRDFRCTLVCFNFMNGQGILI